MRPTLTPFEDMASLDGRCLTSWLLGTNLGLLPRTVPLVIRGANRS